MGWTCQVAPVASLSPPSRPFAGLETSLISWLPHADELAEGLVAGREAIVGRTELREASSLLGAPAKELAPTLVSARIMGLAACEGLSFVHHEQRLWVPIAPELQPELDVADDQGLAPVWRDGIRIAPKYFSAFLEAPFPTYDPNHRSKWRPHELLHRLAKFFWRPDLTRFEAYLGARLCELLPVVHWYGFDEIDRPRCPAHAECPPSALDLACLDCEARLRPVWDSERPVWDSDPDASWHRHAEARTAQALEHLSTELRACEAEQRTGVMSSTPRPGLDAASDAVGYLRGHWNRMTAFSFGAWVEHFCRPGVDYFESTDGLLGHVSGLARRLLCEEIEVDVRTGARARLRHRIRDMGYRALLGLEWIADDGLHAEVMSDLEELANAGGRLVDEDDAVPRARATLERFEQRWSIPRDGLDLGLVFAGGWRDAEPTDLEVDSLVEGLESGLPRSAAQLERAQLVELARAFCRHPSFEGPGDLASRFSVFLHATDVSDRTRPDSWAEDVRLESWLLALPRVDEEAERFAAVPEEVPANARIRVHATLRKGSFAGHCTQSILDWEDPPERLRLAAIVLGGAPRAIELDAEVARALELARSGRWIEGPVARELLESGFIVCLPRPR